MNPQLLDLLRQELTAGDLDQRVTALNEIRRAIAELSPFSGEPVDCVQWIPADSVTANNYNPNSVAPPEMELLRLSIMADGYTQPIVAMPEEDHWTVIDGFHRNRVGKELPDVRNRVHGYLPVVGIRSDREDRGDRIASTIRHNRARGKHQIEQMSNIVLELKRRNWSDQKIGKELGMDPDEVLRLAQISGLAEAFKDRDFSMAWEVEYLNDDDLDEVDEATGQALDDLAPMAALPTGPVLPAEEEHQEGCDMTGVENSDAKPETADAALFDLPGAVNA